jgi:hypothetical protein
MSRTKPGAQPPAADRSEQPQSLIGSYLVSLIYPDHPDRARASAAFREHFPFGAADQEYVGEIVFNEIARDLFGDYSSGDEEVDEFAAAVVRSMGPDSGLRAADMAEAIRAALRWEPADLDVDAIDLMRIHCGFTKAAADELHFTRRQVIRRFTDAEVDAEDEGVWLLPWDGKAGQLSFPVPEEDEGGSGPWDVADARASLNSPRTDLGSLLVDLPDGVEARLRVAESGEIHAVELQLLRTVLQLNAFAAGPGGIWDVRRGELAEHIRRRGGTAREVSGFGTELWTQELDASALDEERVKHARFMCRERPGWMLAGAFIWRGRPEFEVMAALWYVFRDVVVVRGDTEIADGTLLPLRMPPD